MRLSNWRFHVAVSAALATSACGTQSEATQSSTSNKQQLSASSNTTSNTGHGPFDSNQTLGVEAILPALHLMPREALWGSSPTCDPNAQRETQQVCGRAVPTNITAEWDSCSAPMGPPPGGPGDHGGPGGPDGMPPSDANQMGPSGRSGHFHGVTSGSLSVQATVTPVAVTPCDANTLIQSSRQATYNVQVTHGDDGPTMLFAGTNSETMQHAQGSWAGNANLTLDSNMTVQDSNGAVLKQQVLIGQVTVQMTPPQNGQPPQRTINGTLTVDGDSVVLTQVVEGAPHHCLWPQAGTVTRSAATGGSHTLVFSSTCGQATLDGASVTLPQPPHHHPHHP